jgi:hypothetical protein
MRHILTVRNGLVLGNLWVANGADLIKGREVITLP